MGQEAKSDISIWLEPDITTWPQQAISSPDFLCQVSLEAGVKKGIPQTGDSLVQKLTYVTACVFCRSVRDAPF